ncbi:MAG: hypothetical protein K2X32_05385, partial [Phycisphaerales bacterium]|nr:hypothetical protein [Phycisphaerales bacterium]
PGSGFGGQVNGTWNVTEVVIGGPLNSSVVVNTHVPSFSKLSRSAVVPRPSAVTVTFRVPPNWPRDADGPRRSLRAQAISAGHEEPVMVDAKRVNDDEAYSIAQSIAKRVIEEMTFPGEIRVTVLRQTRAIEIGRCERLAFNQGDDGARPRVMLQQRPRSHRATALEK